MIKFVELKKLFLIIIFQIANPTVLEKPGAVMLAPVYQLLFGQIDSVDYQKYDLKTKSLALTEDQITISYKTYKADKPSDMREITDKLAPGEKFTT